MIFLGAVDVYFWKGIESAINNELDVLELAQNNELFAFYTPIVYECEQAFLDGYSLGQELTVREYKLMIRPRIKYKARKKKVEDFSEQSNVKLEGNC